MKQLINKFMASLCVSERKHWVLLLVMHFSFTAFTQSKSGKVKDIEGNFISYANILLMNSADSSLVQGVVSNELDIYLIEDILPGTSYYSNEKLELSGKCAWQLQPPKIIVSLTPCSICSKFLGT